jgi:PTS system cellobiose-specific IIB component
MIMSVKIDLFCSAGMSTSLLVEKMNKVAKEQGLDVDIHAHAEDEAKTVGPDSDVILLGPQIRYMENEFKQELPDKKIAVIPMRDYGMMDGKKVLAQAMELANA